ncbi:HAD-IA family hydrolase [Wenxinia marina]|uniref:phosphoglycolate phosphatase n=1 Tax=Wenxinia marina DSM 24838 TaxID=1123501 RepID=A0A0D0QFJ4_9RHOB|nr:HAD-IA family hydrolase [Wenxinia marina]KIQ69763.1 2-phosphoglycolate phosphatase, prokaryotic [Wenxinia marina DSM 24838]GGL60972.1 phosphoglycolate phosphatase [Wenxinia marina]
MRARIVFDLDGTLIDSLPDIRKLANGLLAQEGAEPLTMDEARGFVGDGAPAFIRRMREARGIPDSAQERLLNGYLAGYDDALGETRLYPGVREALEALAGRHALGVCTNKPISPTKAALAHFGIADLFGAVLGGDSLPVRKPDPGALRAVFERLGSGPEVYVGDGDVDAETAAAAGVPLLLFTEGYRKAPVEDLPHRATFDDWQALPGLVDEVLS